MCSVSDFCSCVLFEWWPDNARELLDLTKGELNLSSFHQLVWRYYFECITWWTGNFANIRKFDKILDLVLRPTKSFSINPPRLECRSKTINLCTICQIFCQRIHRHISRHLTSTRCGPCSLNLFKIILVTHRPICYEINYNLPVGN